MFSLSKARSTICRISILTAALAELAGAADAAPWHSFRQSSGCSNQSLCEIVFPAVPGGRVLEVKSVSCGFPLGSQTVEVLFTKFEVLLPSNQVTLSDHVGALLQGRGPLGSHFAVNHPTTFFVGGSGRVRAQLAIDTITSMFMECKVAGELSP